MKAPVSALLGALNDIDRQAARERASQPVAAKKIWVVLMVTACCLLLLHYMKYKSAFYGAVSLSADLLGGEPDRWIRAVRYHEYGQLFDYLWWGGWHVLCFLVLPMVVIRFGFRENLRDWGWQWGEVHRHWRGYLLLLSPIIVFAILASFRDDFAAHYPFYRDARRSWVDLLLWQCIYMIQFVGVEFFFRGFLLNSLRVPLGSLSIAVMCLPYLMLHFPKPWLEATGAIGFGFFLGVLALRSRSIWGGVLVHAGVALSMDLAAMMQAGGMPRALLP